jgi:hypothetical protein
VALVVSVLGNLAAFAVVVVMLYATASLPTPGDVMWLFMLASLAGLFRREYKEVRAVAGVSFEIETGEIDYQSLDAESNEYSQPVVRLVNVLLVDDRPDKLLALEAVLEDPGQNIVAEVLDCFSAVTQIGSPPHHWPSSGPFSGVPKLKRASSS